MLYCTNGHDRAFIGQAHTIPRVVAMGFPVNITSKLGPVIICQLVNPNVAVVADFVFIFIIIISNIPIISIIFMSTNSDNSAIV